jgi:hypothetical protein
MSHLGCLCRSDGMQLSSVRFFTSAVGIKKRKSSLYRGSAGSLALRLHSANKRSPAMPEATLEDVGDLLCPEGVREISSHKPRR